MIFLCSGVTLVEIISVFACFFKIYSSLVFQNRGAGLARYRLCGRPKEGGRNTKAKLAIKRKCRLKKSFVLQYNPLEFDNRIFEWICCFSGDKGDNGRKSRFHEVLRSWLGEFEGNFSPKTHPGRKRRIFSVQAVSKTLSPRSPLIYSAEAAILFAFSLMIQSSFILPFPQTLTDFTFLPLSESSKPSYASALISSFFLIVNDSP